MSWLIHRWLIHLLIMFTCSRSADYLGLRGYTCARSIYGRIDSDYSSLAESNAPMTCSWLAVGYNLVRGATVDLRQWRLRYDGSRPGQ